MNGAFTFSAPPAVGIHRWLFSQVRIAQLKGFSAGYIRDTFRPALNLMLARNILRREVTDRDLDQAICNIFNTVGEGSVKTEPKPLEYDVVGGWCKQATTLPAVVNEERINRALAEAVVPDLGHSGSWTQLFAPTDLLCVGRSPSDYSVVTADRLGELQGHQFIVPNPLRKRLGTTKEGRLTSHCRDATGPRRFIVMENDHGFSPEDQIKILFWVAQKTETPLRLIVSSGGKSVHGWFDTAGATEFQIFDWVKFAISVGFDPRLILPEQFVRFPGGFRPDKQTKQEIFYTNTL